MTDLVKYKEQMLQSLWQPRTPLLLVIGMESGERDSSRGRRFKEDLDASSYGYIRTNFIALIHEALTSSKVST